MKKIILSADSTCDLGPELREKHNVSFFRFHITIGDKDHIDGIDIDTDMMYDLYRKTGTLPKTAASSIADFHTYFSNFIDQGCEVIHISLSSQISASHQCAKAAAEELEGVYVIDSKNLSTGSGILVLAAAEMIEQGLPAAEIAAKLEGMVLNIRSSFVLDTLEFMKAGGRCSTLVASGAALLGIKPSIEVNSRTGILGQSKKYRGKLESVLMQYAKDQLTKYKNYDRKNCFVTHSGMDEELINMIYDYVVSTGLFDNVYISKAGVTIASHCGPGTLGVIFATEDQ